MKSFKTVHILIFAAATFLSASLTSAAQVPAKGPKTASIPTQTVMTPAKAEPSNKLGRYSRKQNTVSSKSGSGKSKKAGPASKSASKKTPASKTPDRKSVKTDSSNKSAVSENRDAVKKPLEKKTTAIPAEQTQKQPMTANDSIPFMKKATDAPASEPQSLSIWLKTAGSVILILGLLFVGTWVVKKTGLAGIVSTGSTHSPELKILASVSPKNGQTISIVRFGDRMLLVGSTPQSFTLLADDEDVDFGDPENTGVPFEYSGKPVSVADMLAKEETFEKEFAEADKKLSLGGLL